MATEEKTPEIKLKKLDEPLNSIERYNILALKEMKEEEDKDSFKTNSAEENKEIININMSSQEKNLSSKVIKEKSEEFENNNINIISNESNKSNNSENKSQTSKSNKSSTNQKKLNKNNSEEISEENSQENKENDNSSFLDSKRYKNLKENENEELEESNEEKSEKNLLKRKDPFMTTGKFMQIQPHFNIFSKRIETLRDGIYDNTKKCLIYKSCLQHSENLMREKANSVVKDLVEKIFNLRQMFIKSDKEINSIISETNSSVINLRNLQDVNRQDINECGHRIHKCEGKIGYKLLGKPNYSFMKKACQTVYNDNAKNK